MKRRSTSYASTHSKSFSRKSQNWFTNGRPKFSIAIIITISLIFGSLFINLVRGDSTPAALPVNQNWTTTTLITANDNWSGITGFEGFFLRNDGTTTSGVDPQTLLGDTFGTGTTTVELDVIANQSNPNTLSTGGVAEFDGIANPVVALQGSGTADAPFLLIHLNTTGQNTINVSYNLRDVDGSTDNAIQPVALQYRVGTTGGFTNIGAGFVADATTGPSLATLVTPVNVTLPAAADNQAEVQIRIMTTNAASNDEWVGIDDISITSGGGDAAPSVTSTNPTNGATGVPVTSNISVTFSEAVNVTSSFFTISGSTSGAHTATVTGGPTTFTLNPDVDFNNSETVTVTILASEVTDQDGTDPPDNLAANFVFTFMTSGPVVLTPIHMIQGSGNASPLVGNSVTTSGIVTGRKSNGFFIQEPDATIDANPLTSEGVFVFTSSAPPADAAVGNSVQVTGTVVEFLPTGEPNDDRIKLTEISSPTVTLLSTGNPLPTATVLNTADMPGNDLANLEEFEGMRVQVNSMTVVAGTSGSTNEANATGSSNGVFYGVITGIARPFREPGIQIPDPLPAGAPANVPRFDGNPEKLRVDSDAQSGATQLNVVAGQVVSNLVGPLDYGFRHYTILPDPSPTPTVTGNNTFVAVPDRAANEFTIASFNMERFFDTENDPNIGEPVLTTTAFNNRLNKASLAIRNVMKTPDIIGIEEMENLTTLQAVANKVNTDFDDTSVVNYVAYLTEGNDVGGIDVGFLVNSARVTAVTVTQVNASETYIDPNTGLPATLNDRPPLVLTGTVSAAGYVPANVTVIVNHLRSLSGVDDPTDGNRIRTKRQKQAESLANLVQTRQTATPSEKILVIGDLNAFQFNDGFGDSIGTIRGVPSADDTTVVSGDGADLVNPDMVDLVEQATASERYSFNFDGNAQVLDHELANDDMFAVFSRIAFARSNADFPEIFRTDANRPERLSDHDMAVAYFLLEAPTLAKLSSFEALSQGQEVLLQWRTGEEVNNLGFNVYKEENGARRRLTPQLVAGSAFVAGEDTTLAAGRSYAWWGNFTDIGAQYWLEEIDLNGNSVWHGPVRIKSADRLSGSKQRQATLLNMMGREQAQEGVTLPLDVKAESMDAMLSGDGAYELAAIQSGVDVAGRAAVKIAVKHAGLYRLTQPELVAAGLNPSAQAQKLQLFVDGQEIPISINGKSAGQFDASSALEFYGVGLDSPVTEARTYWLVWDNADGKRVQKVRGDGKPATTTSYPYTVERRDRTLYFSSLRNGDRENFFGAIVSRTPIDQPMMLQHLDLKAPGQAIVEVALQGVSQVAHRVNVMVNGAVVGELRFDKQEQGIARFTVSQAQLRDGANQIRLASQNGDNDVSLVDYIRLTYNHSYTADNDALTLTATGKQQITVDGFSNAAIRVFDVTNIGEPVELVADVTAQKSGYAATFAPAADGNRNLLVTTASAIRRPANIAANQSSSLRSASNSADWMIIAHSSLFEAARQLQAYRQSQGLTTKIVDIEDVYDEFAAGNKAPQAVRSFLAYAAQNWQRAPRYVVLMGDSTFDPKDYLGRGDFDLVPTKLIDSMFIETSSDDWFAGSIADTGTKMMIGRLPVRGSDEALRMVAKIINYEQTPKADSVLLVSDVSDTYNFAAASNRLQEIITDGSRVEQIDRGVTDTATARRALLDALKRGLKVVNYTGHGSIDMWRGGLLSANDARGLTNQEHLPLFVMMNCLNGYFQDAASDSLAEGLMKAERGGAVAVWASSGLTVPSEQSLMNQQMFRLLFSDDAARAKAITLGEVTSRAKATVGDADVRNTWILFGDPATRLR